MLAAFISCDGVSKSGALSPWQQTLKKARVQKRQCTMAAPPLSPSEGMSGGTEKSTYFFAIDTPSSSAEQLRNKLHEIDEEHLKRNGRRLQGAWEPTSNYHQTLLYLGKPLTIPAWKVAKATDVLAPYEPFPMRLTGDFDLFGKGRSVVVALVEDGGILTRMQRDMVQHFEELSSDEPEDEVDMREVEKMADLLKKRRGVKAHITVQRGTVRWPKKDYHISGVDPWTVDAVYLYRGYTASGSLKDVRNGGRVYEIVRSIALNGGKPGS